VFVADADGLSVTTMNPLIQEWTSHFSLTSRLRQLPGEFWSLRGMAKLKIVAAPR